MVPHMSTSIVEGAHRELQYRYVKRHRMREPGSDGNLNLMFFKKNSDNTWNLLENMTDRFPYIPDFAWISHAWPLNSSSRTVMLFNFW